MKTVIPDYYREFRCIADRCRHTCCVGWEIDVDEAALERYRQVGGALGEKLKQNIVEDGCPHFRLTPDERCPFLNEQNLCELYIGLGKQSLCQICSDHPRFRNDLSDRTEIGLGLCCEAAAALILGRQEKTVLLESTGENREESEPLDRLIEAVRDRAFEILQNRDLPIQTRVEQLMTEFRLHLPDKTAAQWAELYLSLERLDESWTDWLLRLRDCQTQEKELSALEVPMEQLAVYFLYRHLPAAQDETDLLACMSFAVLGYRLLRRLCCIIEAERPCTLPELEELARLYSSEIEYCEENTGALLELLWEEYQK